jgi:mRNA guanylyltransferase
MVRRAQRLKQWVTDPLKRLPPNPSRPFDIVLKTMQLAYGVATVFEKDIPNLQHGHDGLIFTCCETGYMLGTDPNMSVAPPLAASAVDD